MELIDRDEAIKALTPPESGKYKHVRQIIRGLPAVDAQPVRHGKWIPHPEIGWGETCMCSECGQKTTSTITGQPWEKYCPNCGAKMEAEQDE